MSTDFWFDFAAGWIGGCAGLVAGHPLDTIKVRQQTFAKVSAFRGIVNTFKHEGFKGFYKGMAFPVMATGTLNSLFFGVYGNTLRRLAEGKDQPSYSDVFWAGCAGGVVQLVVACPVDLVKIKMQMQTGDSKDTWGKGVTPTTNYKGPTACLVDIYKKGGIPGCYKGLASMSVRDIPSFGLYMIIYEWFIRAVCGTEDKASPGGLIFCGGMAGALSWMTIVPLDVVKSRLQADDPINPKYKNAWDCIVKSYKNDGVGVFTRGFGLVTFRALPTNGAIFLGYVTSLNMMREFFSTPRPSQNKDDKLPL